MNINKFKVEYPEHLNPFRKGNSLTRSFRGLKKAIVRSFTGKEKESPTLRPKPAFEYTRNAFSATPAGYVEPPITLPRSRFSERLTKTNQHSPTLWRKPLPDDAVNNPFEGEGGSGSKSNVVEDPMKASQPKPAQRKKYKKRKKRAPIPPGSVNGSVNGSEWSLLSTDSEMSSMCYSESEIDQVNIGDAENEEEILKITREIARFTDQDTNNNSIHNETFDKQDDSLNPSDSKTDENETVKSIEIVEVIEENEQLTGINKEDDVSGKTKAENVEDSKIEDDVSGKTKAENVEDSKIEDTDQCTEISDAGNDKIDGTSEDNVEEVKDNLQEKHLTVAEGQDGEFSFLVVHSALDEEVLDRDGNDPQEKPPTLKENIDQSENDEQITGSRLSVKETTIFFETIRTSPTAKIRKNILTKENLLGSDGN